MNNNTIKMFADELEEVNKPRNYLPAETIKIEKLEKTVSKLTNENSITISPSIIGNLLECPRCLWSLYNEGIKRPDGIFPSLPSGMDGVFKKYFDDFRTKGTLPEEIADQVEGKLFNDLSKLNKWRTNWEGISFEFPEFNMILKGAIDELVVNKNDEFVPFDFKTRGYPLKDDTHMHYQKQLDMYALLFSKNGYKVANYGYLLFFWPEIYKQNITKFNSSLIKLDLSIKNAYDTLKQVYDILKASKPQNNPECKYCIYRNNKS